MVRRKQMSNFLLKIIPITFLIKSVEVLSKIEEVAQSTPMKKLVMLSKERFLTDVSTICRLGFRCHSEVLRFLPLRRLIFYSALPDFSPAGE